MHVRHPDKAPQDDFTQRDMPPIHGNVARHDTTGQVLACTDRAPESMHQLLAHAVNQEQGFVLNHPPPPSLSKIQGKREKPVCGHHTETHGYPRPTSLQDTTEPCLHLADSRRELRVEIYRVFVLRVLVALDQYLGQRQGNNPSCLGPLSPRMAVSGPVILTYVRTNSDRPLYGHQKLHECEGHRNRGPDGGNVPEKSRMTKAGARRREQTRSLAVSGTVSAPARQ